MILHTVGVSAQGVSSALHMFRHIHISSCATAFYDGERFSYSRCCRVASRATELLYGVTRNHRTTRSSCLEQPKLLTQVKLHRSLGNCGSGWPSVWKPWLADHSQPNWQKQSHLTTSTRLHDLVNRIHETQTSINSVCMLLNTRTYDYVRLQTKL